MSMICIKCGKEIGDKDLFCSKCGAKQVHVYKEVFGGIVPETFEKYFNFASIPGIRSGLPIPV